MDTKDHDHEHEHEHDHEHGRHHGGSPLATWRRAAVVVAFVVAAVLAARTIFFVDETEYVYVTQFGRPVRLRIEPGLGAKWPFQSLRRFDRRLNIFDPPGREMLTEDKENLNVDWYVCWRIPGRSFVEEQLRAAASRTAAEVPAEDAIRTRIERHVRQFLQAVGNVDSAQLRLEERIQAVLAAALGRVTMNALVSVDPGASKFDPLMREVTESIRAAAVEQYGIEVVDVRIKRINYPQSVKSAVFDEIRSERARVAVRHRAEGESVKRRIQSLAEKHRSQILSRARSEATAIRGEGEAAAIAISNAAHGQDPEFYKLLKTLETYRSMLDDRTTVILSPENELLQLLMQGPPALESSAQAANPSTGKARAANPHPKETP